MKSQTEIAVQESASSFKKTARAFSFAELMKLRLSSLVVFSAVISFFTVADHADWFKVVMLFLGGFLITGAANGFNQIIERDLDKLMKRTMGRPLPTSRLTVGESIVFCILCASAGIAILWVYTNPMASILGAVSIVLYSFVYSPLKRVSPLAVFVGAFPGALPTMIGAVAATEGFGEINFVSVLLFAVQFIWQFPHFWAIAWVSHDDYQKAGFFMLPSYSGRSKGSAFQILIYTLFLIPVSILPNVFIFHSWITGAIIFAIGIWFFTISLKLYSDCSIETARKLMFASFIYLPVVQLLLLAGKWLLEI